MKLHNRDTGLEIEIEDRVDPCVNIKMSWANGDSSREILDVRDAETLRDALTKYLSTLPRSVYEEAK